MIEAENKCTALVRYEPSYLESCIKRLEMEAAINAGDVRDPVTTFLFGMTAIHFLIATGVSVGLSLGAGYIASKFAPKPKPQRVGELTGEVQGLMRSDYGILIPEIYGGDPGDGRGGVKFPATIIWASKIRKTINVTRQSTGGGKFGGGHQTQEIQNVVYDLDFAAMGPRGPAFLKKEWGNTDVLIDLDKRGFYEGEDASNTFTGPYQITSYKEASNGQDATLQNHSPATSAVQFNAVVSNGAATRDLTIYYVTGGIVAGQVIVNGGTPISVSFPNSSNLYSSIVVPSVALNDGNNTIKILNLSTTLNLRIDRIFIFPGSDTSGGTPISNGIVSAWSLDESAGARADSYGANNLSSQRGVGQSDGKFGKCAHFDASPSQYLSRTSNSTLQMGDIDFTIMAWVYLENSLTWRMFVTKDDGTNRDYLLFYSDISHRFAFEVYKAGATVVTCPATSAGMPSLNTWYLIIAWHDKTAATVNIQVNGGAVDSVAVGGALQAATNSEFRVGARAAAGQEFFMDGRIDEPAIWKRLLTSDERASIWNDGNGKSITQSSTANGTGILNPTVPADSTYDPRLPPDPRDPYLDPIDRHGDVPVVDAHGVRTGQTVLAGYSDFAIYEGNDIQLQDPVVQADIDGKYSTDPTKTSTPAYRKRAYTRHSAFQLTRWSGVFPSISQLWEHKFIKRHSQVCAQWCDRVSYPAGGYDFSGTQAVAVRGLLVSGRRYKPKDVMTETEDIYDIFFTEVDGQTIALKQENAPEVTIPEIEIGWAAQESQDNSSIQTLFGSMANEMDLPSRVDVKFIDPDRNFETNTQGESRQITEGQSQQIVEVAITLTAKEADEVATRKLYRDYVEGKTWQFTLSWSYVYLYPGYIINTTRGGQPVSIQLTSMKGSIGALDCEGVDVETTISTQNADTTNIVKKPIVPIPQMTIAALMDTPLLRDRDETENNGIGFYAAATPRTGDGIWQGASLYVDKVGWERIADFTLPATMGRVVSFANLSTDTTIFDEIGEFVIDLYGTSNSTSSASESDVLSGQNPGLFGDCIIQWKNASRVNDGSPNRWRLTGLLHGRRGTEYAIGTHVVNERFVLLNEAVQFIPASVNDLNQSFNYRMVTSGQSLDDSAPISFAWAGQSLRPLSVVNARGQRDSANNLLIEFEGRTRIAGGLRSNQAGGLNEETEEYRVQPVGTSRIMNVIPGVAQAAALIIDSASSPDKFSGGGGTIDKNSFTITGANLSLTAHALQKILATGNFVEATVNGGGSGAAVLRLVDNDLQTPRFEIGVNGSLTNFLISINGVGYLVGNYPGGNADARVRIVLSGSEVRFYVNYSGPGTPPLYVAQVAPIFPLIAGASVATTASGGSASVSKMILTTAPYPKTIYSAAQQTQDGFTPGNAIQLDIWPVSRLVGDGQKVRVTL